MSHTPDSAKTNSLLSAMIASIAKVNLILLAERDLYRAMASTVEIVGQGCGIHRVYIVRYLPEANSWSLIHEWTRASTTRWSSLKDWTDLKEADFSEVLEPLKRGVTYHSVPSSRTGLNSNLNDRIGSKSNVMVPIRVEGRTWGSIGFDDCETERHWTESEVDVLRAVGAAMAVAVERDDSDCRYAKEFGLASERASVERVLEHERAAKERTAKLTGANEALRRTAEELVRAPTIDDTLGVFLGQAVAVAEASAGAILRRTAGTEFEFVGLLDGNIFITGEALKETPVAASLPELSRRDPAGYFARIVAGDPVTYKLEELVEWFPEAYAWQSERKHVAAWDVPFQLRGEVAGYLGIFFGDERAPDTLLLKNVEALANQMAVGFELTRLAKEASQTAIALEREKASRERAAEFARTNEALKQTLDVMAFEPDLEKVLGHVLAAITRQLRSESSALWVFDPASGRFNEHLVYHAGKVVPMTEQTKTALNGPWGLTRDLSFKTHIAERQPVVYQVEDLKSTHESAYNFFQKHGIQTLLGIPLLLGSEITGSLTVRFDKVRTLSEEEKALTQALAHQATMAIQLTDLAKRASEAALSEERLRFAREIHDTLAQGFTGILMQLGAASQNRGGARDELQPYLDTIEGLALSSLKEARRSVRALRPVARRPSLVGALRDNVERVRLQSPASVEFDVSGTSFLVAPEIEDELLRIVGESLANAVKHAHAKQIAVSLEFAHTGLTLSVKDDGVGFNMNSNSFFGSYGLAGMQERAASIHANVTIASDAGRGTEVIIQWEKAKE